MSSCRATNANPIGRISGPPGWELKRHGGPITERIHARERVRLFRELKDLEYEASLYKDSATTKREKAELRAVEAKIAALRLRLGIGSR